MWETLEVAVVATTEASAELHCETLEDMLVQIATPGGSAELQYKTPENLPMPNACHWRQ